jgi:hypothetical protein
LSSPRTLFSQLSRSSRTQSPRKTRTRYDTMSLIASISNSNFFCWTCLAYMQGLLYESPMLNISFPFLGPGW